MRKQKSDVFNVTYFHKTFTCLFITTLEYAVKMNRSFAAFEFKEENENIDPRESLLLKIMQVIRFLRLYRLLRVNMKTHSFMEYFKGMEKVDAVREIFGEKTDEVLSNLKVEFTWAGGYMWVNNADGHLMISAKYLEEGDRIDVYLDLIHELVHIKQFLEGKELFDIHYSYTKRPTEIEAYRAAVNEARRLGLSDERICRYLKTEWMSDEEMGRLAKAMNVNCDCLYEKKTQPRRKRSS